MEFTLGESSQETRSGLKHMPPFPEQNLGTETEVSFSDISNSCQTYNHLCLNNLVDQGQTNYSTDKVAKTVTNCLS